MKPRFFETRGGWIIDRMTGRSICRVAIEDHNLDTSQRVMSAFIGALHTEFGPTNPEIEICPAPASN
ncbi:hypothetical protein [Paracoccus cavernae]